MRTTEMRLVQVLYCDCCGAEIVGNMTVFNQGQPDEKHACHGWIEDEQTRCDLKLAESLKTPKGAQ